MSLFGLEPLPPQPHGVPGVQHAPPFIGSAKADAGGGAKIQLDSVPADQVWVIERVNISANSTLTAQPTLAMYNRDPQAPGVTFLDGSTTGNGDVDDRSVLVLFPGDQLTFVWAGCSVGAICACRVQYHIEAAG